jgi:outer membrane autotransporter protein
MVTVKDMSDKNMGSFKPTSGRFTLGMVVADNVAVEGFFTQGLSSDSKAINGANLDVKAKTGYGIAVRSFVNLSNEVELFGRIGSTRNDTEGTVTKTGGTASETISSKTTNTLYGVGVAYKIDKKMTAIVDYTKMSTKDDMSPSMVAIGVRYNF